MVMHVNAYAELLLRWQLLNQRGELLNSIKDQTKDWSEYRLGIYAPGDPRSPEVKPQTERCTFCRLPIKGQRFMEVLRSRSLTKGKDSHLPASDAGISCI